MSDTSDCRISEQHAVKSRSMGRCLLAGGVAILLGLAVVNYSIIDEAFGSGPPYYGGEVNMDKWTNPLPVLIGIDILGGVAAIVLIWKGKKRL